MNVVFQMIVFNSDFVLEECLKSILPYGKVIVAEGPVKFWQNKGFVMSLDRTNEILKQYVPEANVVHGRWAEKDDESNAPLHLVPDDTDFIWLVDSDEVWKQKDLESILRLLSYGDIDSMSFKANSFYGSFDRRMTGFEENFEVHRIQRWKPGARWFTHRPPTMLAPDGKPWREHRHINHEQTDRMGLRFYHYSYVFPVQMKMKALYYHDMSPTGTIENYFDRVYKPWVKGDAVERQCIEDEFDGVHDWLPHRRGPCRTVPFTGEHPEEIVRAMPKLQARLDKEIAGL